MSYLRKQVSICSEGLKVVGIQKDSGVESSLQHRTAKATPETQELGNRPKWVVFLTTLTCLPPKAIDRLSLPYRITHKLLYCPPDYVKGELPK